VYLLLDMQKEKTAERVGFEQYDFLFSIALPLIHRGSSHSRKSWLRSWVQTIPPGPLFPAMELLH
ncbi:MAG: hypothetical protein M3261_02895, partial [Thermoproteota archaeon]|nr:hypothetical protein [Thermoproteota archaeon]